MEKKRVVYYDLLNICAALCVIFLHCNGKAREYSETLGWYQALAIEVVCYWAVPVFLMLSGATLIGYREKYSTKVFFKKRILRTLIPFVAWSLINAAVKEINIFEIGFKKFLNMLMFSQFENVYWFFPLLFSIYISIPVLAALKDNRKILWYMAGGAFILYSLLPNVFKLIGLGWNSNLTMLTVGSYLIHPILGYLIATTDFSKPQRGIIYLGGIFSAVFRYVGTVILTKQDGKINESIFSYNAFYAVLLACAVFVFFKYMPLNKFIEARPKLAKAVGTVSSCSLGVYLIHMFIIRFWRESCETDYSLWRLLAPFAVYAIALGFVFTVKKIPVLKKLFP